MTFSYASAQGDIPIPGSDLPSYDDAPLGFDDSLDASVDIDLAELDRLDAKPETHADDPSSNVFLQPTPPELCPWATPTEQESPAPSPQNTPPPIQAAGSRELVRNHPLPRFSFLSPEPPDHAVPALSAELPRFIDAL